jgi:putative Holliday junction resolvase
LLDEGKHRIQLAAQMLDFIVGDRDPRQMRDTADSSGVNGHGGSGGNSGEMGSLRYTRGVIFGAIRISGAIGRHLPPCYRSAMAAILPLVDAAPLLGARGPLLGLDLGDKTIGVASSDPDRRLATGVETIARTKFTADATRLLALAAERGTTGFVLGLPINMDGSEGPRAQATRAFARNLAKLTELPIALWDERLSTAAVERELIAADVSRAKRAAVIDQHAAAFILQGALDRLRNIALNKRGRC